MIDTVFDGKPGGLTPENLDPLIDLEAEFGRLRVEKNAVILAHFYQDPDIQDIADFVGDSLGLSRKAAETDADIIAFCGVKFMAEGAKILSPNKTVMLPDADAGCSLESSCQPDDFKAFREAHPDHTAITYINRSAEVKALSDIIVTSSNAEAIIRKIPKDQPILFAPDKHLGAYLARQSGREMTLWPGTCIVHEQFNERELIKLSTRHPDAKIAAHPECPDSILRNADHVGSTSSILKYVTTESAEVYIVATEQHIIHQMQLAAADRTFLAAPGADGGCDCANCPFMALNSLEKLYLALTNEAPYVEIPEDLRVAALAPLQRMLDLSPASPRARNAA